MNNNNSKSDLLRRARWDRLVGVLIILVLLIILISTACRACGRAKKTGDANAKPVAVETSDMTEAPTEPVTDPPLTVFLSPSTQQYPYACDPSVNERDVMFDLAERVRTLLEADGYTVYLCGYEDGVKTKVEQGNLLNCSAYVALHTNEPDSSGNIWEGVECYFNSTVQGSYNLSENIYNRVAQLTPAEEDRGLKNEKQRDLYEISRNNSSCCLLEIAYHDDPEQSQWVLDNLDPLAVAIKNGIEGFLGASVPEEEIPATTEAVSDSPDTAQ